MTTGKEHAQPFICLPVKTSWRGGYGSDLPLGKPGFQVVCSLIYKRDKADAGCFDGPDGPLVSCSVLMSPKALLRVSMG